MRIVVLFPSVDEAKYLLLTEPSVPVFVAGVGAAEAPAAVVRAVRARKPHLVVLAGGAAACGEALGVGDVVEVTSQYAVDLPAEVRVAHRVDPVTDLPETAGCSSDREAMPEGEAVADVQLVSREGAAVMAVCEALGVRCCEIRVVTHRAGTAPDPDREAEALRGLAETLNDLFSNLKQMQDE